MTWIKPSVGWGIRRTRRFGSPYLTHVFMPKRCDLDNFSRFDLVKVALIPYTVAKRAGLLSKPSSGKVITPIQARQIALDSLKRAERARKAGLLKRPQ